MPESPLPPQPFRIPVVCDRCRTLGHAGETDFTALGDLLEFEPVPVRHRVNGWSPDVQRAFIAAVAVTGSQRQACIAVGRSPFGFEQLKKKAGNESFMAAFDRAMEIAGDEGRRRLAAGVHAVTAPAAHWRPPPAPFGREAPDGARPPFLPEGAEERALTETEEREAMDMLEAFFRHYLQRLEMERKARLAGRITEADFYVRQITVLEICVSLADRSPGAMERMIRFGAGKDHLNNIAETTMSRLLDDIRRDKWAEMAEPERPPPPGDELMVDRGDYKLLRSEGSWAPDIKEQRRARMAEYEAAARAQVEWEEKALRQSAEWRTRLEAQSAESKTDGT